MVLIPTGVLRKVGTFDESISRSDDYDMWLRNAAAYLALCVRETLCFKRERTDATPLSFRSTLSRVDFWVKWTRAVQTTHPDFAPIAGLKHNGYCVACVSMHFKRPDGNKAEKPRHLIRAPASMFRSPIILTSALPSALSATAGCLKRSP
jgi:hypothetical protein